MFPCVDGFGSKFLKKSLNTVKHDVLNAIKNFFEKGMMDIKFNSMLVTIIPKKK